MKTNIFIFCLYIINVQLGFSQSIGSGFTGIECVKPDYGFLIDTSFYLDGSKAFYCPDLFPLSISVVDKNKTPITDPMPLWQVDGPGSIDQAFGPPHTIQVLPTGLVKNRIKLKVEFFENNSKHTLSLELNRIVYHEINPIKSEKNKIYSFDDNMIVEYPYSSSKKPYKFLPNTEKDSVTLFFSHRNKLKNSKFKPFTKFQFSTDGAEILNFKHVGSLSTDSIRIIACDTIGLADIDIYPSKTLHVNLYTIAETDDDIVNYCIDRDKTNPPYSTSDSVGYFKPDCITRVTKDWECILPGPDGSLDLFNNTVFWENKDNNSSKAKDSLVSPANKRQLTKIYAASDKFCNEKPLVNNIAPFPSLSYADKTKISTDLNTIYNLLGITVVVHDKGIKYVNFDNFKDDNSIDTTNRAEEQLYLHVMLYGGNTTNNIIRLDTTTIFLVNDMISVNGRATGIARKTQSGFSGLANTAVVNSKSYTERTIAHEIGHGKFYLFHPNDFKTHGQTGLVNYDKTNFMNSGDLYYLNGRPPINSTILRKFQWKLIQKYF